MAGRRRGAGAVGPEPGHGRLVGRARGAGERAEFLDLVEGGRVLGAVERRRRGRPELVGARQGERRDVRATAAHGRGAGRRRPPLAGCGPAQVRRQHDAGPVVLAEGQDLVGHGLPQGDAVVLGLAVRDGGQRGSISLASNVRGLGRVQGDQGPVRRRRDGRFPRRLRVGQGVDQVGLHGCGPAH